MRTTSHSYAFASAVALLASVGMAMAQPAHSENLQQIIVDLQQQNQTLQRSLAEANRGEKQASDQLGHVRERLEALGKNLLDGGDDRLIQAAADLQLANERISELEGSAGRLAASVNDYLPQAVVSDPETRLRVESSLRELDSVLGLRQKPRPVARTGSLQQARIVSLDEKSGMLVLNIGESQGAKIGMSFLLTRCSQSYGKAILADVRKGVSGVFVESLDPAAPSPRPGDLAILETQATAQ